MKQVLLQEITLELMLVGSSAEPKPQQQLTDGGTLGKGPGAAGSSCELLCHIARATQLPAINRFVAALLVLQCHCASFKNRERVKCVCPQGATKDHESLCYEYQTKSQTLVTTVVMIVMLVMILCCKC